MTASEGQSSSGTAVDHAILKIFSSYYNCFKFVDGQEHDIFFLLERRQIITEELHNSNYDLLLYLQRAYIHAALGYPDLAVSDSYRALLLCDECTTEGFEYHEPALAALWYYRTNSFSIPLVSSQALFPLTVNMTKILTLLNVNEENDNEYNIQQAVQMASVQCYRNLSNCLLLCQCFKSAFEFCCRGLAILPEDKEFLQLKGDIEFIAKAKLGVESFEINQLSLDEGRARREIYPWNEYEPDRFSTETLTLLNQQLAIVAPKCEARVTNLWTLPKDSSNTNKHDVIENIPTNQQLGLFAKENIQAGEVVLTELSLLAANNRLKESFCDACSAELPPLQASESTATSCPDCNDISFCSTECFNQAQHEYHPAVCGKDVDTIAKDSELSEKSSALYFLLLCRVLAMAKTRKIHPLDLPHVKYIWGDFFSTGRMVSSFNHSNTTPLSITETWTLPFSFKYNVVEPLHMLEKMDINIFTELDNYDLWIFNTLYSKFRSTASARVNKKTGHPEVAAVHPLWSIANHDCDPNVQWEWGAKMHFYCREKRIGNKPGGIHIGEEILNHYCDIGLKVHERREWAKGSLGGICQCERCRIEASKKKDDKK